LTSLSPLKRAIPPPISPAAASPRISPPRLRPSRWWSSSPPPPPHLDLRSRARVVVRAEDAAAAAPEAAAPAPWSPPTLDPTSPSPIFGGSTGGLLRKAQVEEFYVITWNAKKEQVFEMPTGGAAVMRQGPNLLKLARKEQCLALTTQLRAKFKTDACFYRVFPSGEVQYLHPRDGECRVATWDGGGSAVGRGTRPSPGPGGRGSAGGSGRGRRSVRPSPRPSSRAARSIHAVRAHPSPARPHRDPPRPLAGVYPEKVNAGRVGANQNMRSIGSGPDPAQVKFTGKATTDA